jgi:glutamate racemase
VPLVEEGWTRHPVTLAVLREYLTPLLEKGIDTLVLGCTHYPLLKPAIRTVAGRAVALVDSAASCADYVRQQLAQRQLLQTRRRSGSIQPFVTDEPEHFSALAGRFLKARTQRAVKVNLTSDTSR